jgi:hypothetical protein
MDFSGLGNTALVVCGVSLLCVFVLGFILLSVLRLGGNLLGGGGGGCGGILGLVVALFSGGLGFLGGGNNNDDEYGSLRKPKGIANRDSNLGGGIRAQSAPLPTVTSFDQALAREQQARQSSPSGFSAQSAPNPLSTSPSGFTPATPLFNAPRPSLSKGVPYQPPTSGFAPQQPPQYPQQGGFAPQQPPQYPQQGGFAPQQPPQYPQQGGFAPQQPPQYPQQGGFAPQQPPQYPQQGGFAPPQYPQIPRPSVMNNPTGSFDEQVANLRARQQARRQSDDGEEFFIDDSDFDPFN